VKKGLTRQILAFALSLAMLFPTLAEIVPIVRAETVTTYGEANVYDISDLTGSEANTVNGTDATWDGVVIGNISAEHKENVVFKTKLTMGEQQIRLALNSLDGNSIYDPQGYAVYINHNGGTPYIAIKRNQTDLVVGSPAAVAGTWELEIGIVDILSGGTRVGKHLYVKKDGEIVCEVDDTTGYLTGDALGTKIVDFHYGAAIQMDTTKAAANTYGEATIYDISDLTGSEANTVNGTDATWDGVVIGNIGAEHKENVVFKTKLTMGEQQIRLALNSLDGNSIYDPQGYAVYINHNGGTPYIAIKRNQTDLVVGSPAAVAGTWELEIGIVDILSGDTRVGKHLYVKKDGEIVCEVDDTTGYLTGDALGTKIVDFHYGAAIQMDTTKAAANTYGEATIYDISDLTGSEANTVNGTDATWDGVVIGNISAEHKENVVFKTKLTMGEQQIRLALNSLDGNSIYDPQGYAVYINHNSGAPYIAIKRNQQDLVLGSPAAVAGTWELEIGIVDILSGGTRVGKHLYVKKDGEIVCEVDDTTGYLTGDALGTKIVDFHYGAAIQMDTTKAAANTYGEAAIYDISDLTGSEANTINGTDATWDGVVIGNISAEHKENFAVKAKLTMGAQEVRLSLTAKDGDSIYDPQGYAVFLYGATNLIQIRRNNTIIKELTVDGAAIAGTYVFEAGIVDILSGSTRVGKHIYVKMDDVVVCEYDDMDGYYTGDALGTKIVDFHYGAAIQMDTTKAAANTYGEATIYDISDLTGSATNTINGTDATWDGVVIGNIGAEHKENFAVKAKLTMGAQEVRLSLTAKDGDSIYDPQGYAVFLYGATNLIQIRRNNTIIKELTVDGAAIAGTYVFEAGIVDILSGSARVGKHIYVKMGDVVVCEYDDMDGYYTGDALGTKIVDFHYGAAIQMDATKQVHVPTNLAAGNANVYDLYDLQGIESLTLVGRTTDPDAWGTTLGNIQQAHKGNMAFKTTITNDEAQTVMLGIGLQDSSMVVHNNDGYVLEIITKTGTGEADTLKIHRAGATIYCQDQSVDLNGEYELEFGVVDLYDLDADNAVVGKRVYVKMNGEEVLHYDDMANALSDAQLGTKIDVYVSGEKLKMTSIRGYVASNATVYDLYDLAFRKTLEVNHSDDGDNVIWGVLIGNVEKAHKGNVALKTKVKMSADQQQNLLIGLGLNGHWPVSGGFGYQIELIADPNNETDSLRIYKKSTGDTVLCFGAEQSFDFNGSFELEVGVVDLLDGENKVAARRIYVKVDGEELMHFDDTNHMITGSDMGNVVAAYVSSGTATLGTCAKNIPSANVKIYDIYDLLGRASVQLNRTDAGGAVIWTNELGRVTESNNLNYALRVNVDTSKVSRKAMQEMILGLCRDTDMFDKAGYRLSLYFGTDGGTSLVLRDSATDEVLASADGVFPTKYELEIGITDFYNSQKAKLGKKIYLKINGEEVLSYLDKSTDRNRGNLLCAYTTTPIKLTTDYSYVTIPVSYVVNGEATQDNKYIISNTDVIPGKKSIIDIALSNKDALTSVKLQRVLLNGQPITPVSDKQGVYVFELENPSADDELTVEIEIHNLTVDEAKVYDLYELTGKKEIVIPAYSVDQIGTLFAEGQEELLNRAIRFAYYIPKTGGGLRLGYGSDTSDIWSRTGTHIELWCGFATISHGFHVSALSTGNTDIFKADSWSIVEVGIVKCYEDGVYKYDRWYVKAGKSLEDMELITYFDSTQRYDGTLNIMVRTPDTGDDFVIASTMDVRKVTDVSAEEAKEEAAAVFKPLFLKGEDVKLTVFPKEGKKLETLYVNGEKVTAVLTSDGGYTFTLENAEKDVKFSYVLSDDNSLYNITADNASNLKFILDKASVLAGGSATVQIKVDGGYTLKSLLVNDVDFLSMASYDKTTLTYTLTISGVRENKHIQAQAEKLSEEGPVAEAGAEEEENKMNLPLILAVAVLAVAALGGAVFLVVNRARKKG